MNAFELSSRAVDNIAAASPIAATYFGIPGHDSEWDDLSPRGAAAYQAVVEGDRDALLALDPPDDPWEALAIRVGAAYLDAEASLFTSGDHHYDLNTMASTAQSLREVFDVMDPEGEDDIVARAWALPDAMAGYIESLEEGRHLEKIVARRQVLGVMQQAATHAGDDSFFASLLPASQASQLPQARSRARAAFADLHTYLRDVYAAAAPEADPVGPERYRRAVRRVLGGDIDLADTYDWGWAEVSRLLAELQRVGSAIDPDGGRKGALDVLTTDPDRSTGHEQFVALMMDRQQQALTQLAETHFDIPDPIRSFDVKIAPPGGSLGAYYIPPSEDFTRPGTVWYSLGGQKQVPLYDQVSTAYHEGFPGHHLQCGVQVSLADRLSRLHRLVIWYPGYGEGWALYTERLMEELGYFEKPDYLFGMLTSQMLRACRVVIDIGSHLELPIPHGQPFHPGAEWSYDIAVEMLTDYATLATDYARSEVDRYLGWPGQAIAYKVGERQILDLRDELRRRQGSSFDLKDFHARVLGSGPVGIDLLPELVLGTGAGPGSW